MRKRYSFSSKRTRHLKKMTRQRPKYPELVQKILQDSNIILEILDARFPEQTRNQGIEKELKQQKKQIIYILNKSDLINKKNLKNFNYLIPNIAISCKKRTGIKQLRDLIKKFAKKVDKSDETNLKVIVGVLGYPNTGKSSLINLLVGKASAGVGSEAGYTKGLQKIKLSSDILLIDSPGVIPQEKYSPTEKIKLAEHTIVGGRSYTQVKEPDIVIHNIMKKYPNVLEKHYKIDAKGDSEALIEQLGKKKGFMKKGGIVNEDKTARAILKDWQKGEIEI